MHQEIEGECAANALPGIVLLLFCWTESNVTHSNRKGMSFDWPGPTMTATSATKRVIFLAEQHRSALALWTMRLLGTSGLRCSFDTHDDLLKTEFDLRASLPQTLQLASFRHGLTQICVPSRGWLASPASGRWVCEAYSSTFKLSTDNRLECNFSSARELLWPRRFRSRLATGARRESAFPVPSLLLCYFLLGFPVRDGGWLVVRHSILTRRLV
jgi:hypothetical protein